MLKAHQSSSSFYQTNINSQTDLDSQLCNPAWATWESLDTMVEYSERIDYYRRLDSRIVSFKKIYIVMKTPEKNWHLY